MMKWSDERKKAKSESMKELYKDESYSQAHKEALRNSDLYKRTEHHQNESQEEYRAYQREYQRKWREAHPDYYRKK